MKRFLLVWGEGYTCVTGKNVVMEFRTEDEIDPKDFDQYYQIRGLSLGQSINCIGVCEQGGGYMSEYQEFRVKEVGGTGDWFFVSRAFEPAITAVRKFYKRNSHIKLEVFQRCKSGGWQRVKLQPIES